MKKLKLKKLISGLMATTITMTTMSAISSFAAASPKIYVDIVYQDANTIRADVKFENMPDILAGGFHLQVGSGWNVRFKNSNTIDWNTDYATSESINNLFVLPGDEDKNNVSILFYDQEGLNLNGTICSFYLTKKSGNTGSNSVINVVNLSSDNIYNANGEVIIGQIKPPVMLEADEYIIGDADGNGTVDAMDSSYVLMAIDKNPNISVASIGKTFRNMFSGAKSPAAPDADQSGYINQKDANDIINYYSAVATGGTYNGNIGKKDIYEIFDI